MRRVLVANRGEIAVRILRACRERGLATVAVCTDADRGARHTREADAVVTLGASPAADTYLSVEAVLDAVRRSGADAVHPGYGFLSERAALSQACADRGVVFVGPGPDAIARLGDKIAAREVAAAAGVAMVSGEVPHDQSDAALRESALRHGLPILLKPAAGGGGIGMRAVHDAADLDRAIAQARRDAVAAFGDGTLFVERLLARPHHVEVQVLADAHGHVVHLFERECSVQRRHQKVIEESPSHVLSPGLRDRMGAAAVALARAAGYRNAGTVEFLVEGTGDDARFFFLEVNTRLQVEHPVTEALTGIDIVHAQLAIAAGEPLPWSQEAIGTRGHAIEARLYAEDPARSDLPQAGRLLLFREPTRPQVRVDSGVSEGDAVSVHYDPLLAKVIASGETRDVARRRLVAALRDFPVLGVHTNAGLLLRVLEHPDFTAGGVDTNWLDRVGPELRGRRPSPAVVSRLAARARSGGDAGAVTKPPDPWDTVRLDDGR